MALDAGFKKTTSTDNRGWLWVTTILSIIYTVSVLVARLFGKYGLWWYDDATLVLAYCLAIARWGIQMRAMSDGLGADLAVISLLRNSEDVAVLAFIARILLIVCLYLTKLSLVVFSRRVFSGNFNHETAIFAIVYSIIIAGGIASILASSTDCHPSYYLFGQGDLACSANIARSVVICFCDAFSEIAIIAVPFLLVSKLQMRDSKKLAVNIAFAVRLGVVAFGISQAVAYQHFLDHQSRASIGLQPTLSLQELWLMYSFISATIPNMRPFLGAFHSPTIAVASPGNAAQQPSYANRGTALSSLKRTSRGAECGDALVRLPSKPDFRPDGPFYGVDIRHEERKKADEGDSLASDSSEQMIIRRDTQIHVEPEERAGDGSDEAIYYAGQFR